MRKKREKKGKRKEEENRKEGRRKKIENRKEEESKMHGKIDGKIRLTD